MSSIYALEPRTNGHAILHTTHGPIELFLWSAEAPQATRNFIQHALDGYYDGLPFHRILPDVLVQTGDPSRTGTGGVPASGDPAGFAREVHGRLKFRRRGIAAMVADDAGRVRSQFFVTLRQAEWLDGQHTIFGCVQGDTIYNLLNLAAGGEVDGFDDDNAPRVNSVSVMENPFPDIVARPKVAAKEDVDVQKRDAPTAKRAVKSAKLLSFGGDSESDSDGGLPQTAPAKMVDVRRRVRLGENGLAAQPSGNGGIARGATDVRAGGTNSNVDALKSVASAQPPAKPSNAEVIRRANEEFERLKRELLGGGGNAAARDESSTGASAEQPVNKSQMDATAPTGVNTEEARAAPVDAASRKRKRKAEENETLRRLKAFENRLVGSRRNAAGLGDKRVQNRGKAAWFSQGLRLATQAMEEEEYEVRFASTNRGNGRKKKR